MQEPTYSQPYSRLKQTLDVLLSQDVRNESRFLTTTMMALGGGYIAYDLILKYVVHS